MLFLLFHVYPVYDSFLTLYTLGCYVLQGGYCRVDSVGTRVDIVECRVYTGYCRVDTG